MSNAREGTGGIRYRAGYTCAAVLAAALLMAGCQQGAGPAGGGGGGGAALPGPTPASSVPAQPAASDLAKTQRDPQTGLSAIGNEVLAIVEDASIETINAIEKDLDLQLVGAIPKYNMLQFRLSGNQSIEDARKTVSALSQRPEVKAADLNWVSSPELYTEDGEGFSEKQNDWDYKQPAGPNWWLEFIRAPLAWNVVEGDKDTKIAILDCDFDSAHPDLQENVEKLVVLRRYRPGSLSGRGHGTHVAGTAGACANNGRGVAGVAYGCRLMLYWVDGTSTMHFEAMRQAAAEGCRVINRSWGPSWGDESGRTPEGLRKWRESRNDFWRPVLDDLEENGVTLVQSAGNDGVDAGWCSPGALEAEYDNLIVVAASDSRGQLWSGSNKGSSVTVAAPGAGIYSCRLAADQWYGIMTGTSMATPVVTGLVGLALSLNPELTPGDVKRVVTEGAEARGNSLDGGKFCTVDAYETITRVPHEGTGGAVTRNCLLADCSGSMGKQMPGSSSTKMEAAREAAGKLLASVQADARAHAVRHEFGLVSFDSSARAVCPVTDDIESVVGALSILMPGGRTNISDALSVALSQLESAPANGDSSHIILLSDGMPNEGLSSDELVSLDNPGSPVGMAAERDIRIFTVGFGQRGSSPGAVGFSGMWGMPEEAVDEELLQRIASSTGGEYFFASDAFRLQNVYLTIHHQTTGEILNQFAGSINEGEELQVGEQEVAPNTDELYVSLNWPGSLVSLDMRDPSGRKVDEEYPRAQIHEGCPTSVYIREPAAGEWQIGVEGVDCPNGPEPFEVVLSSREGEAPEPDPRPVLVAAGGSGGHGGTLLIVATVLVLLMLTAAAAVAYGPYWGGVRPWYLEIRPPAGRARILRCNRRIARLGRSDGNDIVLHDDRVSGRHLTIGWTKDGWLVRDLKSKNGTWIGGKRRRACLVTADARIRVGSTTLVVRAGELGEAGGRNGNPGQK